MSRARIGITFSPYASPEEQSPYLNALASCDADVQVLFDSQLRAFARRQLEDVDGILLAGGGDIDPFFYREEDHGHNRFVSRERDIYELALARHALRADLPILGICRGIQTMVVAARGTLYQDLASDFERASDLLPEHTREKHLSEDVHQVTLDSDCLIAKLLGATEIETNSRHHQAAKQVRGPLHVVAHATDGVIEAVEGTKNRFLVGVQWHPEYPPLFPRMKPLFDAFIEAASL